MVYKWKTSNNFKIFQYITQNEYADAVLILCVNIGANSDETKPGICHYLEHMLVAQLTDFFKENNITFLATTYYDYTTYEIMCPNSSAEIIKYIELLKKIYMGKYLSESIHEEVRTSILLEYNKVIKTQQYKRIRELSQFDKSLSNIPIGKKKIIETLQYSNIIDFYKNKYLKNNCAIGVLSNLNIRYASERVSIEEVSYGVNRKKYESKPKGIVIAEKNKCIIYKKEKYSNSSCKDKFIKDISTYIIETVAYQEWHLDISFYKAYYSKYNKYLITIVGCTLDELFNVIERLKRATKEISYRNIKEYRKRYMEAMQYINPSIEYNRNEFLYFLTYNIPISDYYNYVRIDKNVNDIEILNEIYYNLNYYDFDIILL